MLKMHSAIEIWTTVTAHYIRAIVLFCGFYIETLYLLARYKERHQTGDRSETKKIKVCELIRSKFLLKHWNFTTQTKR